MTVTSSLIVRIAALLIVVLGIGDFERGNRLFREGRYEEAVEAYRAAIEDGDAEPAVHYNLGTALLRLDRYEEADRHFDAALRSIEPDLRQRAFYNLGNRYLRAGRDESDPAARRELFDGAVAAYKQSLRLSPGDEAAKWNLELALAGRDRLPPPPTSSSGGDPRDRDGRQRPNGNGAQPQSPNGSSRGQGERPFQNSPGTMTPEQAERLLRAVAQDERELLRSRLRRGSETSRSAREW